LYIVLSLFKDPSAQTEPYASEVCHHWVLVCLEPKFKIFLIALSANLACDPVLVSGGEPTAEVT